MTRETTKPLHGADVAAIEAALRNLGLLYGTTSKLSEYAAQAPDEEGVIRKFIERERPHLLSSYELQSLIKLVRAAMHRDSTHSSIEQFSPKE